MTCQNSKIVGADASLRIGLNYKEVREITRLIEKANEQQLRTAFIIIRNALIEEFKK